jgi:hypothetical protein
MVHLRLRWVAAGWWRRRIPWRVVADVLCRRHRIGEGHGRVERWLLEGDEGLDAAAGDGSHGDAPA